MLHFPSIKGGEATNKFRISICIWNKTKCIYDINHHWVMTRFKNILFNTYRNSTYVPI